MLSFSGRSLAMSIPPEAAKIIDEAFIAISSLITLASTIFLVSWWIRAGRRVGFYGVDMNKPNKPKVVEAGGVWVSVSASFGLLTYIALRVYSGLGREYLLGLMALSLLLFMSSFLGFLDDVLGWKKGLRPLVRVLAMAPLAISLVVIKAGYSTMALPFIGRVDFGILYPLLLVPIGVLGAANAFNMIAGYNGLEATQGLLLMGFTAAYAYARGIHPSLEASIIMSTGILGFLYYNWYPARTFPGNSFTYGLGAYYASLVVLGNFEKYGLLLFTLYYVEFILFLRGLRDGVYKENYAVPSENGLMEPYDKIYSLTHFAIRLQRRIRGRATEKGVVFIIAGLQIIVGIASLILVRII
jgi:UDP-N-acetylglucosamine--dolichyl-phosphate N-acetylglucosaminephosphotransferase